MRRPGNLVRHLPALVTHLLRALWDMPMLVKNNVWYVKWWRAFKFWAQIALFVLLLLGMVTCGIALDKFRWTI